MWKTRSAENLVSYVDEIERYFRARRRLLFDTPSQPETQSEMGDNNNDNRPLKDFVVPSEEEPHTSIVRPAIAANNFELKPLLVQIIQQNQFSGNPTEDPNLHLATFVRFAETLKVNGVHPEAIRLRLFPFSLRDRASAWLDSLPSNSITTWNELKKAFLARYFPPRKTAQMRNLITCFRQKDGESLFEAWERYKDLLRACLHHGLEKWLIIHTFYNGLLYNTKMTIDAAAGGALMNKPFAEAWGLIEDMAQNHYQWGSERALAEKVQPKAGMYEVSSFDHMSAKVDELYKKNRQPNHHSTFPRCRCGP